MSPPLGAESAPHLAFSAPGLRARPGEASSDFRSIRTVRDPVREPKAGGCAPLAAGFRLRWGRRLGQHKVGRVRLRGGPRRFDSRHSPPTLAVHAFQLCRPVTLAPRLPRR
jgi:hypothetical protein